MTSDSSSQHPSKREIIEPGSLGSKEGARADDTPSEEEIPDGSTDLHLEIGNDESLPREGSSDTSPTVITLPGGNEEHASTSPYVAPEKTTRRAPVDPLEPGSELGHFVIEQYIGGGGMGCVYKARDATLHRPVALKVLSKNRDNQETISRFINEAESAARLNHENIAQVYFAAEEGGIHYIVFEFVEGVNLRAIVEQEGTLSPEAALSYALQIAAALKHASERSIVHRDVKPSNILVTSEERIKLIDMGLARITKPDETRADLTATGITLGTFDYISPEQARDPRTADARSDIYSLGCTFFYMLTGRPPFPKGRSCRNCSNIRETSRPIFAICVRTCRKI